MLDFLQFSVSDMTPYDRETWFTLVGDYNGVIRFAYPVGLLLTLAMLRDLYLTGTRSFPSGRKNLPFEVLGIGWIFVGAVFHNHFFSELNWAAPKFGLAFVLQGILLLTAAYFTKANYWAKLSSLRGRIALFLLFIGLIIYPLSGLAEGRSLGQLEWFPMLPAPLTLVTFAGLILWKSRWRYALIIIPFSWAMISAAFAGTLGLLEFYFLVGAMIIWTMDVALSVARRMRSKVRKTTL